MQTQKENIRKDNFYFPKYNALISQKYCRHNSNWQIRANCENNFIYHLSGLVNTLNYFATLLSFNYSLFRFYNFW